MKKGEEMQMNYNFLVCILTHVVSHDAILQIVNRKRKSTKIYRRRNFRGRDWCRANDTRHYLSPLSI